MKWTKDCSKNPCGVCSEDWMDFYGTEEDYYIVGTMLIEACGDGCCQERVVCDWCDGTGVDRDES